MTSGAPWSVKGIDPKAREVAKDLARRSGMTLGEWLNRMILDDDGPEEITSQAYFSERSQRSEPARLEVVRGGVVDTLEPPRTADPGRVAVALDRLNARPEPRRTPEAIAADTVMRDAIARLDAENSRLAERLARVEAEAAGPRSAEALRSLEAALSKVAGHLHQGEGRTRETLRAMEQRIDQLVAQGGGDPAALLEEVVDRVDARLTDAEARTSEALVNLGEAFANLDGRVSLAEQGSNPEIERRIETLAATLSQRVDDVRGEIAEAVRKAEQVSGEAVERMGREVLTMADALNRQVQEAEHRSADAIERVGGEVARIAQAMESRLGRSESAHAEALERLGAEISRITDRLAERIGSAERRSAQAIDDVGEQVARVSERLGQRQDDAINDLSERIRQSEERTARLLEEARGAVDRGLADSQRRLGDQPLVVEAAPRLVQDEPDHDPFKAFGPADAASDPLALQAFAAPEVLANNGQEAVAEPDAFEDEIEEAELAAFPQSSDAPVFDAEDFEAADGFEPIQPIDAAEEEAAPALEAAESPVAGEAAAPSPEPARPLSTREVIEQARAAARASAGEARRENGGKIEKLPKAGRSFFPGLSLRKRAAGGGSLQTALLVAGGAACLSLGAASYFVVDGQPGGETPKRVADALAVFESDQAGEIEASEADTAPVGAPLAAVALAPQPMSAAAKPTSAVADDAALAGLYAVALSSIQTGEPGGVESLRKAANLGHSPAQFYLAKLYAEGGAGLKKDAVEARRWTERAAEGGNRAAMHNLGIALADGQGGPKSASLAAEWFRRAAELGLVDSQYNLGVLYEQGRGVNQNAAEAYKWYLIAARSRDDEALRNAARVRATLSPEARTVAERTAQAFRATELNPSVAAIQAAASTADLSQAQRALSLLGYYQGPTDGASSPALKMAIAAYQRKAGLTATGSLDPTTLSRLQVFTQ